MTPEDFADGAKILSAAYPGRHPFPTDTHDEGKIATLQAYMTALLDLDSRDFKRAVAEIVKNGQHPDGDRIYGFPLAADIAAWARVFYMERQREEERRKPPTYEPKVVMEKPFFGQLREKLIAAGVDPGNFGLSAQKGAK